VPFVVDSTFATPIHCNPVEHGADIVIHSTTKFIAGHNDVSGGIVLGPERLIGPVRQLAIRFGGIGGPFDAWLVLRGLKTLAVRMRQSSANALALAEAVKGHPAIERVRYPGLSEHPQHDVACSMLRNGFASMLSIDLKGGRETVERVVQQLEMIQFAETLGGLGTTVVHPATTSHRSVDPEIRRELEIGDGLLRFSIGIEEPEDLIEEVARIHGFERIAAHPPRAAAPAPAGPVTSQFRPGEGPSSNPAPGRHRTVRSFVPRRSRVTDAQRQALLRRWPEWGVEIDGQARLDLGELFAGRPVVLEIGFGMGEATAEMAAADPDTGVLAVDVHTPGQGHLLRQAELRGLDNVRVGNGDALLLLESMLPERCLAGVRVYFPDPWPKKRHHKRRIIQPAFVELCASRMAPGAVLHCATDWEPYAQHMLEVLTASPSFENTAPGFAPRPAFRPLTRFEQQGLTKGHTVHDLLFRRLP
jgi:tRNA (guanine-N7-)-methyltransferase